MNNTATVTCCLTSAGRYDLLEKTLESFFKYNTYNDISEFIISEDTDFDVTILDNIREMFYKYASAELPLMVIMGKVGQIASIDRMYKQVTTPYIFHMEDDFEFFRHSFVEKSIEILECDPKLFQVHLREQNDLNGHKVVAFSDKYDLLEYGCANGWSGFSLNSGLRKTADYKLVGTGGYASIGHELELAKYFYDVHRFIAAITKQGYVRHIGGGRTVRDVMRIK